MRHLNACVATVLTHACKTKVTGTTFYLFPKVRLKLPLQVCDKTPSYHCEIGPNSASIPLSGFVRLASIPTQKNDIFDSFVVQRAGGYLKCSNAFPILLLDPSDCH